MTKETLKVGNATWKAQTVPVNKVFDETYGPPSYPAELAGDRFQIVEMDGYYLTVHQLLYSDRQAEQEYKCFLSLSDAQEYLKMFGVDFEVITMEYLCE